jgi:hypothetical protein
LFPGLRWRHRITFADSSLKGSTLYLSYRGCCNSRRLLQRIDLGSGATTNVPGPPALAPYVQDGTNAYHLLAPGAPDLRLVEAASPFS